MKIPCIRCNKDKWSRIKPYLVKWGYNISGVEEAHRWSVYPILSINRKGKVGDCINVSEGNIKLYGRCLVTDTNEFLTEAARVMGFEYPDKVVNQIEIRDGIIVEIKPGMVIEGINYNDLPETAIVFPIESSLAFIPVGEGYWNKDIYAILKEVTCIKNVTPSSSLQLGGNIVWEKPKVIELTIDEAIKEIAGKRGVSVECIRIKS
jgi:hypothetical protein